MFTKLVVMSVVVHAWLELLMLKLYCVQHLVSFNLFAV